MSGFEDEVREALHEKPPEWLYEYNGAEGWIRAMESVLAILDAAALTATPVPDLDAERLRHVFHYQNTHDSIGECRHRNQHQSTWDCRKEADEFIEDERLSKPSEGSET